MEEEQRKERIKLVLSLVLLGILLLLGWGAYELLSTKFAADRAAAIQQAQNNSDENQKKIGSVLGIETSQNALNGQLIVNVPASFYENVVLDNKDLDVGDGKVTASNLVYSVVAGNGVIISGDPQNPTIASSDTGSAQNIFKNVIFGGQTLTANSNNDSLQFVAGSNVNLSLNNRQLVISAVDQSLALQAFGQIKVGSTTLTANSANDLIEFVGAGSTSLSTSGRQVIISSPDDIQNVKIGANTVSATTLGNTLEFVGANGLTVGFDGTNRVVLTAPGGLTAIETINGQSGPAITINSGTTGTDFNVATTANTLTLNLPDASTTARGAVTIGTQTFGGAKTFNGALTASSTLDVTGLTTLNGGLVIAGTNAFSLNPFGVAPGSTTEQRFQELAANGTNYVGFKAPDSIAISQIYTLPATGPTLNGQVLAADTSGALFWSSPVTGVSTIDTIDSQTKSADGAVIVGSSLYMQTADATNPGLVSTGTQTFAGAKTFSGAFTASSTLGVTGLASLNGGATIAIGQNLTLAGVNSSVLYTNGSGVVTGLAQSDGVLRSTAGTLSWDNSTYLTSAVTNVATGDGLTGGPITSTGTISVNAPTCAGTDKLQWTGTAFVCSPDIDTNTTYTAGNGLSLTSTTFSLDLNNPNTWTALQTFAAGATISSGQDLTLAGIPSSVLYTDASGIVTGLDLTTDGVLRNTGGTLAWDNTSYITSAITSINGQTGPAITFATGVSGTDFNLNVAANTLTFNLPDASVTSRGVVTTGTQTIAGAKTFTGALTVSSTLDVTGLASLNGGANASGGNLDYTGSGTDAFRLLPYGATTGNTTEQRFLELTANGSEYVGFKSPDAITTSQIYTLPSSAPTINGQVLSSNTSGVLSWSSPVTGATTIGTIDSQTKSAEGGVISGTSLYFQTADATNPGLVSATTQTFGGAKTFSGALTASSTLGVNGLASLNAGANISGASLNFTGSGSNAFNLNPYGVSSGNTSEIRFNELTANGSEYVGFKSPDSITASQIYTLPASSTNGVLRNTSGTLSWDSTAYLTSAITSINSQSGPAITLATGTAGTDFTISASGNTITFDLPDASATSRGLITTGTQTIAGAKTFSSAPTISTFTSGSLVFAGTGGTLSQNNTALFWDNTNSRLGIGNNNPSTELDLNGAFTVRGTSAPSLAAAGEGVMYFDSTTNKFKCSESGNPFVDCISAGDGVGVTSIGTIDSQTKSANGAVVSGTVLYLQTADATNPGLVSTGTQTIAGAKTFTSAPTFSTFTSGSVAYVTTGGLLAEDNTNFFWDSTNNRLGIGTNTPGNTLDVNGATTLRGVTSPGVSNTGEGVIYFDSTANKFKCSENGTAFVDCISAGDGVGATAVGAIDSQTKSANGGVISGTNLYFQTADTTNPGLVSTGTQTFAGAKTFSGALTASSTLGVTGLASFNGGATIASGQDLTLSGVNDSLLYTDGTGIVTGLAQSDGVLRSTGGTLSWDNTTYVTSAITSINGETGPAVTFATGTSGTDFNLAVTTNTLTFNLPDASASNRGVVTTGTQSFAGAKTFTGALTASSTLGVSGLASLNAGTTISGGAANFTGSGTDAFNLNPYGVSAGNTSELRFNELTANGSEYVGFKSPDAITTSQIYTLPNTAPSSSGQVLSSTTGGVLSWTTPVTGVTALGAVDGQTKSSTNGAVIASNTLYLQTADTTNPGLVSTTTQTFAGAKTFAGSTTTFTNAPTISAFTSGSVPFVSTGGLLAEDNSNFFWDEANNRLGVGTNTPAFVTQIVSSGDNTALGISAPGISGEPAFTVADLPLSTGLLDGKAFQIMVSGEGFARSVFYSDGKYGIGDGTGARDIFLSRSAANTFTISSDASTGAGNLLVTGNIGVAGVTSATSALDINGALTQRGISAPSASSAGQGRIYFDSTANKFKCSENTGAYFDCFAGGSGVTTIGTINSQTKSADGAVISGSSLYLQTADATNPGLVSTASQTIAGAKTFTSAPVINTAADGSGALQFSLLQGTTNVFRFYDDGTFVIGNSGDCNTNFCLSEGGLDSFFDFTISPHNGGQLVVDSSLAINSQNYLKLYDGDGSNYIGIRAPTNLTANRTYTYPTAYPTKNGQVLLSTTSGVWTWSTGFTVDGSGNTSINLTASTNNFALCHETNGAGAAQQIKDCSGTPAADYMEFYSVTSSTTKGDIVYATTNYITTKDGERLAILDRASAYDATKLVGIVSDKDKAGDFNSVGYNINDYDNPQPIALSGRVPVNMDQTSSPIQPGDLITVSYTLGKGTRLNGAGYVVGKALESWTPGQASVMVIVQNYYKADSLPTYFTLDSSNNLTANNNLKINGSISATAFKVGNPNKSQALSIISSDSSSEVASIVNTDSTDSSSNGVLRLSTGTASTGQASRFLQFYAGATNNDDGTLVGQVRLNNNGVAYETSGADFAEYFTGNSNTSFENGDVVVTNVDGRVDKSQNMYDRATLGVVTNTAAFVGNVKDGQRDGVLVGLVGQINTKVSNYNGDIQAGDRITISPISGVAMKATESGMTIGIALENFDSNSNYNDCDNYHCGQIKVYVNPAWQNSKRVESLLAKGILDLNSNGALSLQGGQVTIDKLGNIALESGDLILQNGKLVGNDSFRGRVSMPSGRTSVRVNKDWNTVPASVIATPSYKARIWITNIDQTGFTINVDVATSGDKEINWLANF